MKQALVAILILALAPAGVCAQSTRPGNAELEAARRQHRQSWERNQARGRALEGRMHIADLIRIEIVNDTVRAYCNFKPDEGNRNSLQLRTELIGIGDAIINITGPRDGKRPITNFSISAVRYDEPNVVAVNTNLHCYTNSFSIGLSRTLAGGGNATSTSFSIQRVGTAQSRVNLYTYGQGANLNVSAASLTELTRNHRSHIERHLRPLFRSFGLESLLAADPGVAWQVLIDGWQSDPALEPRIARVLPRLDDDSFEVREAAIAELEKLGKPGALAALRLDRSALTPQQNLLLDRMLTPYLPVSFEDARRLQRDHDFLLDCLYVDDAAIATEALRRLEKLTGKKLTLDLTLSVPERADAIAALRAKLGRK